MLLVFITKSWLARLPGHDIFLMSAQSTLLLVGHHKKSQGSIQKKLEVKFQNVMNVAGFHHKLLGGPTAWTRYFSDEQLVYFTTSMSSQKKPGVNAKKWK
jgi:hypothetical protein